jgi:sugar phosphate isomerase/epimerase
MRLTGINYCDYYGLSPYEFAAAIKSCGFDAAFTDSDNDIAPSAFAKAFYENGIAWETIHAPFKGINEIWKNGESGDRILAKLKTTVDICAEFSVPTAVIHLSSGEKAPSISDIGKARFSLLVEHAVRKNVSLAFENQRKLANIAWVFEEFSSVSNVGFCWDVGHEACYMYGMEFMPLFGKRMVAIHFHDNTGVYDEDMHWLPYDGVIDMDRAARHFAKSGYQKSLMLEVDQRSAGVPDLEEFYNRAHAAAIRFAERVEYFRGLEAETK